MKADRPGRPGADETHATMDVTIPREDWLAHMVNVGSGHGAFSALGRDHHALFVEEGPRLVVSFDDAARLRRETVDGMPLGFEMVKRHEWSLLSILSEGPTWFRHRAIGAFFDQLTKSGVLGGYKRIVVVGLGPVCGHAACAHAGALPGARVLTTRPAASPAWRDAPFETRFRAARRLDFSGRFGFAPDGLRAVTAGVHLFDPLDGPDAAQAALFRGSPLTRIPLPHGGAYLDAMLSEGPTLARAVRALAEERPDAARLRAALRPAWRGHLPWLERRIAALRDAGHDSRADCLARHAETLAGDRRGAAIAARPDAAE